MPTRDVLSEAAEKLRVYDVDQHGWEHEGKGVLRNIRHVQFHLAKDLTKKDFDDEETARAAVAPDAVQYALRLARWTSQSPEDIRLSVEQASKANILAVKLGGIARLGFASWMQANVELATNLHDIDHESSHEAADAQVPEVALTAAGYLIYGANALAQRFNFGLPQAFDQRLSSLRQRLDIPPPPN